jgi:hypothetical protein
MFLSPVKKQQEKLQFSYIYIFKRETEGKEILQKRQQEFPYCELPVQCESDIGNI